MFKLFKKPVSDSSSGSSDDDDSKESYSGSASTKASSTNASTKKTNSLQSLIDSFKSSEESGLDDLSRRLTLGALEAPEMASTDFDGRQNQPKAIPTTQSSPVYSNQSNASSDKSQSTGRINQNSYMSDRHKSKSTISKNSSSKISSKPSTSNSSLESFAKRLTVGLGTQDLAQVASWVSSSKTQEELSNRSSLIKSISSYVSFELSNSAAKSQVSKLSLLSQDRGLNAKFRSNSIVHKTLPTKIFSVNTISENTMSTEKSKTSALTFDSNLSLQDDSEMTIIQPLDLSQSLVQPLNSSSSRSNNSNSSTSISSHNSVLIPNPKISVSNSFNSIKSITSAKVSLGELGAHNFCKLVSSQTSKPDLIQNRETQLVKETNIVNSKPLPKTIKTEISIQQLDQRLENCVDIVVKKGISLEELDEILSQCEQRPTRATKPLLKKDLVIKKLPNFKQSREPKKLKPKAKTKSRKKIKCEKSQYKRSKVKKFVNNEIPSLIEDNEYNRYYQTHNRTVGQLVILAIKSYNCDCTFSMIKKLFKAADVLVGDFILKKVLKQLKGKK